MKTLKYILHALGLIAIGCLIVYTSYQHSKNDLVIGQRIVHKILDSNNRVSEETKKLLRILYQPEIKKYRRKGEIEHVTY